MYTVGLVKRAPRSFSSPRAPVGCKWPGREAVGMEFTLQHMPVNPDFLGNVGEGPASLPHRYDRRDLVWEQRHLVGDIGIRQFLPMDRPARVIRDVGLLRRGKLGPLLGAHLRPQPRVLSVFG